jgi:Domain of unknown function (DUF1877)
MVGMSRGRVEEVAAMEVDDYFEFVSESLCLELDRAWAGVGWLAKAVGIDDNTLLFGEIINESGIFEFPLFLKTVEEVAQLAASLELVSEQVFRDAFDPAKMMEDSVYPEVWDRSFCSVLALRSPLAATSAILDS